jgi:hypothetical protein
MAAGGVVSANEEFFRSRKSAAVLKHGILKRYPVVFAAKTGRGNPVVFLDGYAGRGEYGDGEPRKRLVAGALRRSAGCARRRAGDRRRATGGPRVRETTHRRIGLSSDPDAGSKKADLAPQYVLVLFTTHREGAWHFADALGKAGVEWEQAWVEEQVRRGEIGTPTLFGEPPVFDPDEYAKLNEPRWVAIIEQNIDRLLSSGQPFRLADAVPEVYGTVLGQAWIPQVRAAIRSLHRKGSVAQDGTGDFWKDALRRA